MLRCTVLYPNRAGATFDFDYYISKHIPMANEVLGGRFTVSKGLPGPDGTPPGFVCVASIDVASPADFAERNRAGGARLQADLPNYTNIVPVVQMDEILT